MEQLPNQKMNLLAGLKAEPSHFREPHFSTAYKMVGLETL